MEEWVPEELVELELPEGLSVEDFPADPDEVDADMVEFWENWRRENAATDRDAE